tara:strand:+ start:487 stop:2955 length:2469 start_codon:yes stop_codon:yes gene_type:complete
MAFEEINKPTNIDRVTDLIDLDIEAGQEVEIDSPVPENGDVEVNFGQDGSAVLDYMPDEMNVEDTIPFNANLADYMDESELGAVAAQLLGDFEEDRMSRDEWEDAYVKGLDLLGFRYEDRDRPFPGASGVTHPLLAESVTQFQAQAFKELLPAQGPVKTEVLGLATPEIEAQADRVREFMNYEITTVMEEYTPEMDQLLFYLPLAGSAFKKVYYDTSLQRAVSRFVPVEDLVVPYAASDLGTCTRITHIVKMTYNEIRNQQLSGFYRDIEITPTYITTQTTTQDKVEELEGISGSGNDMMYELLEFHVAMELVGFEDPDGLHLPFIITIDRTSSQVLSIRRNYYEDDAQKKKIPYFVHYKFLPGLGFYGFGLIHMIGGLSRTATAALRQLIDAGTLANLPAGFKARGIRIRDDETPLQPGEFRDVDAPGGALKDALMPLPYKEPSATLFQLMGFCVEAGQRFAAVTDMQVGEGNEQAAVGTTLALLEQGTKVMSAVHKRLHYAQKTEFRILARVFSEFLPPEYPYQVVGGDQMIKQQDFDGRIDVIPVSDPNFFSFAQRISLAQQELQLVQSNPDIHNIKEAYRRMYTALGSQNIETLLLPDPPPPQPTSPALENAAALMGAPLQAFPDQDHDAHIESHITFLENPMASMNPPVATSLLTDILQHVAFKAEEIAEQQLQQMAQQDPQLQQQLMQEQQMMQQQQMMAQQGGMPPQPMPPNPVREQIKAQTEANLLEELMPRVNEVMDLPQDNEGVLELKQKELMIRSQENEDDKRIAEDKLALEREKMEVREETDEEKMRSQEDIAALRASISREKMNQPKGK